MAHMTTVKCKKCKTPFEARTSDVNRGWGKFCSKSCKAKKQTQMTGIDGAHYKAAGRNVDQMRNGSFAKSQFKGASGRKTPWASAGVSRDTFLHYAEEYGGYPLFDSRGEYEGFIPEPFDNSTDHQNSGDPE